MRRLTTLAAALLLSAPLFAADAPKTDAPKTDNAQTPAAAPADSPLVAAAKRAAKKRTGKTTVITNATLAKSSNVGITTTESQPAITLPVPDAALIAMREKANQPQAKTAPAPQLSPAELDRQRRAAARAANAEDAGPYSDTPHSDEVTVATTQTPSTATTQNPSSGNTQNPSAGQTQNPEAGKTQSPDSMQKKKP